MGPTQERGFHLRVPIPGRPGVELIANEERKEKSCSAFFSPQKISLISHAPTCVLSFEREQVFRPFQDLLCFKGMDIIVVSETRFLTFENKVSVKPISKPSIYSLFYRSF
jgi:hypothetical protein